MLDSLCGVSLPIGLILIVVAGVANIRDCNTTLSTTHEAESLASASWSQHSSIVSQSAKRPYEQNLHITPVLKPRRHNI